MIRAPDNLFTQSHIHTKTYLHLNDLHRKTCICPKKIVSLRKFCAERRNTMENIIDSLLDKESLPEVGKTRLAEYKAIRKKVDAKAKRLTRKELNMPKDEWWFGSCHTFWKHKKKILREEYHMIWRSPQDLNPECCFD